MNSLDRKSKNPRNGLNSQGMYWVIATLLIAMSPQLISMTAYLLPVTLLPVAWRVLAEVRGWRPMPMLLRVLLTAFAVTALVLAFGGLMGRRAAVSLLVMMLAMKLLETFSIRDARIVASLSLFLCATQFLFTQGIPMLFYMTACLLGALIALMFLQRGEAYENLGDPPRANRNLFAALGFSVRLLVLALPIGLAMFLLFPRWGSPLWGVPEEALDAKSGLSDSMSPGSIQNLFMDDSPAFRVQFAGDMPAQNELYWRGPVFWNFDGRTWRTSYLSRNLPAESVPEPDNALVRYELQIEPTEQRWLFALDYPAVLPPGTHLSIDYELRADRPITQLRDFTIASDPGFVDSPNLKQTLLREALELPQGLNPRTAAMMAEWRAEAVSDTALLRRALAYFHQEAFFYTLNPPLLSNNTVDEFLFDTRRGFCEHYASAFTVMMRFAGIPARVVTGYQGGWYSDLGGYVLVRQSDAHAWSEVWIKGSGWTRIDPTAAVAPQRVENGAINSLAQRRHLLDFNWLRDARNTFDLLQRGWNNWIIAFNSESQSRLFTGFGWGVFDAPRLMFVLLATIVTAITAVSLLMPWLTRLRASRKQDHSVRLWQSFLRKLRHAGATPAPSMAPKELAAITGSQLEQVTAEIHRIADLYTLCRYSSHAVKRDELEALVRNFHPRSVSS